MPQYHLKAWTGPTIVREIEDKCLQAGIDVMFAGTEYIYVKSHGSSVEGAAWNVLVDLYKAHHTDFGLKFVASRYQGDTHEST